MNIEEFPHTYQRVVGRMLLGPLNRREAAEAPICDYSLPTTISKLRKFGLRIEMRVIRLPGHETVKVAEYRLLEESFELARRLLGIREAAEQTT